MKIKKNYLFINKDRKKNKKFLNKTNLLYIKILKFKFQW